MENSLVELQQWLCEGYLNLRQLYTYHPEELSPAAAQRSDTKVGLRLTCYF